MVLTGAGYALTGQSAAVQAAEQVLWHDLECGGYLADLPLWRELADRCRGPILEVGAGTGRVALELARDGHEVTALDRDADLLAALSERAVGLRVQTVCADARSFELDRHDFGLCIVPMQTIQLLGGAVGRVAFLRRARAHLRPGGRLACAILTAPEPFDCAAGDVGPSAETAEREGLLYASRATRVEVLERAVLIERERSIVPQAGRRSRGGVADAQSLADRVASEPRARRELVALDRVSAGELESEAVEAGLRASSPRAVAPTDEYVGSAVVMLRV